MSDTPWTRLQAPFPRSALTWDAVDVTPSGDEAVVRPRLTSEALHGRLDDVVGMHGWSVAYAALEGGLICTLRIGDVSKSAVVTLGGPAPSAERRADLALARAAERFGLCPPVTDARLAPYDADSGDVLDDGLIEDADLPGPGGPLAEGLPATVAPTLAATPRDDESGAEDEMRRAAEARGVTVAGQQMIDRLVDRLKAEGQGLAAARLLVRYGGYGKDPAAARELYAQLRALLLRAGEPTDAGA